MEKLLSKYEKEVMEYFKGKAEEYDDVEKQTYWRLSDKLLWSMIKEQLDSMEGEFLFLDAGGGTGRWSKKILEEYPMSKGVLVDLSDEMLEQAIKKNNYGERWKIIKRNLHYLEDIKQEFDVVINTHNVLGFVENYEKVFNELTKVLKKGGLLISVVPNVYHGIYFNVLNKNISEAEKLVKENKGRFVKNMPYLDMFSPKKIKDLYLKNNFEKVFCFGFPVSIYPGYQETQLQGESEIQRDILLENFEEIYQIEMKLIKDQETAARGNNLFVLGVK